MSKNEIDDTTRKNMLTKMMNSQNEVIEKPEIVETENNEIQKSKELFDADYAYSREKLKSLVDMGEEAITNFKDIADETGEPRAYSVLAELLKNTGDLVSKVMQNAETKDSIDTRGREYNRRKTLVDKSAQQTSGSTNNTTIFVGSTKELLEKIVKEESMITIDAKAEIVEQ